MVKRTLYVIPGMAIQANLQQEMMRPEVVEDVKQNMDTDDTRDEVLDVSQLQRELRNSYAGDGHCNFKFFVHSFNKFYLTSFAHTQVNCS